MVKCFKLKSDKPLSKLCLEHGYDTFDLVFNYIKNLPYGRPSNRSDYTLVLQEKKGTCSTKHALLKAIAIENDYEALKLCLGIFKMNAQNTPKIAPILKQHQLDYIPEAHCYLRLHSKIIDVTFGSNNCINFEDSILYEDYIDPVQIGSYKVDLHQSFLKSWIEQNQLALKFEDLWNIREACILSLSE